MAKVKIYLDPIGNTMNIWWGKPNDAFRSEEIASSSSNDVIIKNKNGTPIGLEIIGIFPEELNLISLLKKRLSVKKEEPFLLEGKQE